MKQVVLRIDDAAFEKFMGMVSLCPQVEVVNVCDTGDKKLTMDSCVASAIREMRQRLAFRSPCDYAYLMVAMNESVVKGLPFFYTPKDFIDYMREADFDNLRFCVNLGGNLLLHYLTNYLIINTLVN